MTDQSPEIKRGFIFPKIRMYEKLQRTKCTGIYFSHYIN
jgi:hypothetical protein